MFLCTGVVQKPLSLLFGARQAEWLRMSSIYRQILTTVCCFPEIGH